MQKKRNFNAIELRLFYIKLLKYRMELWNYAFDKMIKLCSTLQRRHISVMAF